MVWGQHSHCLMPDATTIFQQLGLSLLLGLLVGLQREHSEAGMPGLRTFPLITVFGTVAALLGLQFGGWVLVAGLVGLVGVLVFPNLIRLRAKEPDPGITTDVAVLVMYGVGALLVVAPMAVAVVIGGGVAVLLQFKPELHRFSARLGAADLRAIMQFVLLTCIVLPVLPNRAFDPLGVLNPFEIWLMVVLIVGLSLGGYIAYKFLGRDAGILLGGLLGGAISSTATTVSYSRMARQEPATGRAAAIVIMIASTVVFFRVLVEICVVSWNHREFVVATAPPLIVMMLLASIPSLVVWYRVRQEPAQMPEQGNPTQLKTAVVFALMYAGVSLALAYVKRYVGSEGLYVVALLSGLTDMDAITISTARLAATDPEILAGGWRLIVVASLSNMGFKAGMVGLLGSRQLLVQVAALYAVPVVGGLLLVLLWPG